jgi:hypothetical protein
MEALTEEEVSALKSCDDDVTYRLTKERRLRLESIGFVWSVRECENANDAGQILRSSYDDQWATMFEILKEYREAHGHCMVPKRYKANPKLGTCESRLM